MSLEGKKDTDKWFPVILTDDTDFKTAETGKAFGDVTCKYSYEAAVALTAYNVTADDWKEAGEGKYWLRIGASEFTSIGKYEVSVMVVGCLVFNFAVEVKTKTETEAATDIEATVAALNDISVSDILTAVIEGTITFEQMMKIFLARMAGKASGGGTTSIAFRDLADSKDRIAMTVDVDGNRSAVTLDGA